MPIHVLPLLYTIEVNRYGTLKNTFIMFDNKTMRNTELMRDYRRIMASDLASGGYVLQKELIRRVLTNSRPYYDATFDHALRMMQRMVRDGKPCNSKGIRREMWEEIKLHVEEVVSRRGCNLADAVAIVLAEKRASRYFLSVKQAYKVILHEYKNSHRRLGGC